MKYVIALDAGTTSIRACVYDVNAGGFIHIAQQEVSQSYPNPGWVEQDADEIWYKAMYCLNDCVRTVGAENVVGIGLTNQRETVVMWNRETGEPVCPAIVWQCRRTSDFCAALPKDIRAKIQARTGLLPDAYFSASKMKWCLENVPEAQKLLRENKLCAGTVDSYLIFRLTEGRSFVTDTTNASRTMLFDIRRLVWDGELLAFFGVPQSVLPEVVSSDARVGECAIGGKQIPIAGVAGDQQAALVGQGCFREGDAKVTYGTGLFLLFNTGKNCATSSRGLLSTVAYTLEGKTTYALEGSVFNAGSSVQWLRDELKLISSAAESEALSRSVPDTGGVRFVPAFTGLGAPYWAPEARGLLSGITRGTNRAHVVRAVLESIAFGARELSDCMIEDSGIRLGELRCDGGASANDFLMQFQSDVLGIAVNRPKERESTALGAALLCASSLGLLELKDAGGRRKVDRIFLPDDARHLEAEKGYSEYLAAVKRAL